MRYFLISIAVHAAGLGVLFSASYFGGITLPQFSIAQGDGAAGGNDGDLSMFEGEFVSASQPIDVRLHPVASAKETELHETNAAEEERHFSPTVETKLVAHSAAPAEIDLPPIPSVAPPPVAPANVDASVTSGAPEKETLRRAACEVDVGELMTTSTGPESFVSSENGSNTSVRRGSPDPAAGGTVERPAPTGSGGHGGDGAPTQRVGGQPTPYSTNVAPPYPREALVRGIEGRVTLHVLVGVDGGVRSARVEVSSGDNSLDQSALTTVREQWHFEPARRAGETIEMEVLVPINFHLQR